MTVNFNDVGRIGSDAQVRQIPNGGSVANFPLAVDSGFGQNKTTVWLDCALFGKRAEGSLIQYLTKGTQVQVVGEIGQRQYQKQDGSPGFSITLNVQDLKLIGGQQSNQQTGYQQQSYGQPQPQNAQRQQSPQQQNQQFQQPQNSGGWDDGDSEIPF